MDEEYAPGVLGKLQRDMLAAYGVPDAAIGRRDELRESIVIPADRVAVIGTAADGRRPAAGAGGWTRVARPALALMALVSLAQSVLSVATSGPLAALPFAVLFTAAVVTLGCTRTRAPRPAPQVLARPEAWDVSVTLDHFGITGLWHYEDASGKPHAAADAIIRVIPRSVTPASRILPGPLAVTSWTAVVCAPDPLEGAGLLRNAAPLLAPLLARDAALAAGACGAARYFRLEGGVLREVYTRAGAREAIRDLRDAVAAEKQASAEALRAARAMHEKVNAIEAQVAAREKTPVRTPAAAASPCAHRGAVPVDLLVGGERVAWLCVNPECDAQLPAGWGG